MKILGIDPGAKGGIVLLDTNTQKTTSYKMPITRTNDVNVKELLAIVNNNKLDLIVIEKQFILNWQKGKMSIGANYGRILAIVELSEIKSKIITGKNWKKKMGLSGASKEQHIKKCLSLGFQVPRRSNRKNSPYNDGIADAYLIAYSSTK